MIAVFEFLDPGELVDGELSLVLVKKLPGNAAIRHVPAYHFEMRVASAPNIPAGHVNFRAQTLPHLELYGGHIGYAVEPAFRGHHYAERGTRLLFPLARRHGYKALWITCNPDNWPSRRTCERLGGAMIEIVALPRESDMYRIGERYKCRYRVEL